MLAGREGMSCYMKTILEVRPTEWKESRHKVRGRISSIEVR